MQLVLKDAQGRVVRLSTIYIEMYSILGVFTTAYRQVTLAASPFPRHMDLLVYQFSPSLG